MPIPTSLWFLLFIEFPNSIIQTPTLFPPNCNSTTLISYYSILLLSRLTIELTNLMHPNILPLIYLFVPTITSSTRIVTTIINSNSL